MAWVSPTAHNDPESSWGDEANSYDDDTGTYAVSNSSDFLEFTIPEDTYDKIRVWARWPAYGDLDIDIYYGGAWHDVYQGSFNDDDWTEKSFSVQTLTKYRVRLIRGSGIMRLYETDANECEAPAVVGRSFGAIIG